jgi:3-oxoacyl-(acyl-carrier-protein) synthase
LKRRVVITGMGAVSPNGVGNAAFGEGILQGRSGVRHISRFDPAEIPVQIAGEVADFDELAWVEKRERKHVSRVLPLALAAATEALREAGIDAASLPLEQKRRFGVIPALLPSAIQADESVLRAHGSDGNALERTQRSFWLARAEPCSDHGMHFVHRRLRVRSAADSDGSLGSGADRRCGCPDRAGHY